MTEDLHDIGEMGSFVVLDYIQGKGYRVRVRTKSGMVFVVYWQEEEPPLADTTLVAHGALGAESSCSAQTPYEVADTTLVAHGAPGTESSCSSQTPYAVAAFASSSRHDMAAERFWARQPRAKRASMDRIHVFRDGCELYVGNEAAANDEGFLRRGEIKHIVNCTDSVPAPAWLNRNDRDDVTFFRIDMTEVCWRPQTAEQAALNVEPLLNSVFDAFKNDATPFALQIRKTSCRRGGHHLCHDRNATRRGNWDCQGLPQRN